MSWFRTKPSAPPVPLPAATFSPDKPSFPKGSSVLGVVSHGVVIKFPETESMEDIVRRVVREELDRRFGPQGE